MEETEQTGRSLPMARGAVDDPAWRSDALSPEDQERKAEIDAVIDPVESMKQRPDTKNLTLGEIKRRDEDNLRLVLQGCREYRFETLPEAMVFIKGAIGRAMTRLGVTELARAQAQPLPQAYGALTSIPGGLYVPQRSKASEDLVTGQMVDHDVRVEIRHPAQYPNPDDKWKAGMYLYHGSEIAFFISNPMMDLNRTAGDGHIIIPGRQAQRFFVKTNAPGE